jgi:uncharacterized membrane protein
MAAAQRSSLWIPITGFACGIIALVMVVFMLGERQMYPLWTIVMIAAVGALAFFYGIKDVRERLE